LPAKKTSIRKSKRKIRLYKIVRFVILIFLCYFLIIKISGFLNIKQPTYSSEVDFAAEDEDSYEDEAYEDAEASEKAYEETPSQAVDNGINLPIFLAGTKLLRKT
jgi:hypothetical protein